ncbi:hypothetical protein [Cryobacterium sp. Y82]|nr:hypothetical protein [Cryobacterium sp. Y82]
MSNPLWKDEYEHPAMEVGISLSLDEAVFHVNQWVAQIRAS